MADGMDLADIREVFDHFSNKEDDRISVQQVGDVLRAAGCTPTESEVVKCIASFEEGARLSFEEFVPICQSFGKIKDKHSMEDFVEGLSHFDKEGNGTINVADLRYILTAMGERMSDEEVDQLLAGHNYSDGNLDIADFVRKIMNP